MIPGKRYRKGAGRRSRRNRFNSPEPQQKRSVNWTSLASYFTIIITSVSVFFTSQTFKSTEKWKKNEFIASQFEKFSSDTSVSFVTFFLDYFSRRMQLSTGCIYIEKDYVGYCLMPDSVCQDADSEIKSRLREYFDGYLDKLSLFNRYYRAKLVTYEDIKPYLEYQLTLISEPSPDIHVRDFQRILCGYIRRYGFKDVQELCALFGHDIQHMKDSTLQANSIAAVK